MHRIGRRSGLTIATAIAAPALAAGAALAAAPAAGLWSSPGESGASFIVTAHAIKPAGTSYRFITAPSNFRCNTSNLVVKANKIAIRRGRFRYDGPAYIDRFRAPKRFGHLVWTGRFTSPSKVTGTWRFTTTVTPKVTVNGIKFLKRACNSGKHTWRGQPLGIGAG